MNILLTFLTISNLSAAPLVWWRDLCCFVKSRNLSGIQNKTPPSICSLQLETSLLYYRLSSYWMLINHIKSWGFQREVLNCIPDRTLSGLGLSSLKGSLRVQLWLNCSDSNHIMFKPERFSQVKACPYRLQVYFVKYLKVTTFSFLLLIYPTSAVRGWRRYFDT